MKFQYEGTEYDLVNPDEWTTVDAMRLEKFTGKKPAQLVADLREFDAMGMHAAMWISVKRAGVDVAWDEFEVPYFGSIVSMAGGVVQAAPDPSPASTPPSKAARPAGRTPRARSPKS